ncbi:MAG: pectate lyase [Ponticaulis sp.]|nr:pectate lyase [Ponticaulis sp.]
MRMPKIRSVSLSAALMMSAAFMGSCALQTMTATAQTAETDVMPPTIGWEYGLPAYASEITDGGAGGEIVKVTTLASSGPGSLREAVAVPGPKTIVFEVAGVIDLEGEGIRINESDITIAGQTAPSPGITIIKGGFVISGQDVIVQHLRIRPGDFGEALRSGRDIDAISTTNGAKNVVVDHCSLSWSTDENLSASSSRFTGETPEEWRSAASNTILYSLNIIAEGLSHSTHAKGEHSKGSLIHDHVNGIVIYGNLYTSNFERSPLFKGDVHGAIVNNFIYNPGQRAIHYNLQGIEWKGHEPQTGEMDLVSNVMRYGPSTVEGLPMLMIAGVGDLSLYESGNIAVDRWGNDAPMFGAYTVGPAEILETESSHMSLNSLTILPAKKVEGYVLANAGARPWDRDVHDVRVTADAAEGRGEIIDSQSQVGGYPETGSVVRHPFDPDAWELSTMSPKSAETLDAGMKARGT